jgi:ketosteroid isomerase-like protein
MSAAENIATIKALYEAFGRGDVDTILENLTDDVDWASEAAGDDAPWWGERHGKEETSGFFQGIAETVDVTEFTPLAFTASENEVMTRVRYGSRAKAGGPATTTNLHHYWRFRDGKVEYYRGSEDTQVTVATLAGQPARATSAATS